MPAYFKQNSYKCPPHSTKGPIQFAFNTPLETYQYWQTKPDVLNNFHIYMQGHFSAKRLDWLEWFPLQSAVLAGYSAKQSPYLFVDVGGGRGHQAHSVRTKFPDSQGIIVLEDLPEVIDSGTEIHPDIEKVKQNFFEENAIKGARVYYLAHIMHNWPTDECIRILKNIHEAMTPGYSKALLCDLVLPDTGISPRQAALDLGMLTLHSGMQRSKQQWSNLAEQAGLRVEKFWMAPREGDGIVQLVRDD
ncbi:MAG: hypothetical protein M1822_000876 [Bathelium mastoideum]|nr:MAG: hypothetical protein M1822_000876 [Bathelium mastoideum]